MAMLRWTPCGERLASKRKCINAGEPRDNPATSGPNPVSSSVWNYESPLMQRREEHDLVRTAILCRSMYAALEVVQNNISSRPSHVN